MPNVADKKAASKGKAKAKTPRPRGKVRAHLLPDVTFPLFPHASGQWAAKVNGRIFYFGKWNGGDGNGSDTQWEAALKLYELQIPDIKAGRTPRSVPTEGLRMNDLCSRFMQNKKVYLDAGELAACSFTDYYDTCELLLEFFTKHRLVVDIATDDFEQLRAWLAKTRGPVSLGNEINRIRMVFKWGFDAGLIPLPIRYGQSFKRPSKKTIRHDRHEKGERMFEAPALRRIIREAGIPLRAMVLLGVNAGFGNQDIGTLPLSALDLDGGWVTFPRPKTGIKRRCPLWPETVAALNVAIAMRPTPKDPADGHLVFLTKYRTPWAKGRDVTIEQPEDSETVTVQGHHANPLSHEFRKLLLELGLYRAKITSFYTLRHVFETIGGDSRDQVAVNSIMGHVDNTMAGEYRERIIDSRLRGVTDYVRTWLLTEERGPTEKRPRGGWRLD